MYIYTSLIHSYTSYKNSYILFYTIDTLQIHTIIFVENIFYPVYNCARSPYFIPFASIERSLSLSYLLNVVKISFSLLISQC